MYCLKFSSLISDNPDTLLAISIKTNEANMHNNRMTAQLRISGIGKLINYFSIELLMMIGYLRFTFSELLSGLYSDQSRRSCLQKIPH